MLIPVPLRRMRKKWRTLRQNRRVGPVAQVLLDHPRLSGSVLVIGNERTSFREALEAKLPAEEIEFVIASTIENSVRYLRTSEPPSAIVDVTGDGRLSTFRAVVWALAPGGLYIAPLQRRSFVRRLRQLCDQSDSESTAAKRWRSELSTSVQLLPSPAGIAAVLKLNSHAFTLRHREVEETFAQRFAGEWGEVLERRPGLEFRSKATLVMHGEPARREKSPVIQVPSLAVRHYRDVTCFPREIAVRENLILPESFRHWQSAQLFHRRIVPASRWTGRIIESYAEAPVRRVVGDFFSFDSAFPTHFGHLLTETLSKYWGWQVAKEHFPNLRVIMTRQRGRAPLPTWKSEILGALGVPLEDVLWINEPERVHVSSLVAAMPQLENPKYADPALMETWRRLSDGLPSESTVSRPEKIFLSRKSRSQRWCVNVAEVEQFVSDLGYAVIYPETMTYAEQAETFRSAKVIAGFAGSAMFNIMLNPSAKVVVLTSRSYLAANEYLFASVAGHEIHYFWAPAELEQPEGEFSVEAYRSAFRFPLEEHHLELTRVLR